jgi:hypothetical protein
MDHLAGGSALSRQHEHTGSAAISVAKGRHREGGTSHGSCTVTRRGGAARLEVLWRVASGSHWRGAIGCHWSRKVVLKYVTVGSCFLGAVLVAALAVPAQANECDKETYLTFSDPVSLPGVVLPAGTYLFSHPDCSADDHVLRVSSKDGSTVYATLLVSSEDRPTPSDQPMVVLAEMPNGSPRAIKAWFYPGETIGDGLIYPKGEARPNAHSGAGVAAGG